MSGAIQTGAPFPPPGPTTTQGIIPSYLYQQYRGDAALESFVEAFNIMAQEWLDWFNRINLPVWSGLSGALLDWIGAGLYGIPRPTLSIAQVTELSAYGTMPYGTTPYGMADEISNSTFIPVTDDVYKRVLTWHLWRGDGFQFNTRWLKQRVHRFLNGADGVLAINDTTTDVSVTFAGASITITLADSPIGQIFQFAVSDDVVALPFQYDFTVTLI